MKCKICLGKPFKITSICREDMLEHFSPAQIAKFGDKMMEDLANRISSAYLEHSFWIDLEIIVDFMLENM